MKNISKHIGIISNLKREASSVNGNPRFSGYIAGVHFYTMVDSMLGYSIQNYENKTVEVTIGTYYGKPSLNSIVKVE